MTPVDQLAARLRFARQIGAAKRRQRVPRAQPPKLIEADYASFLVKLVRDQQASLAPLIAELPALSGSALVSRGDDLHWRADIGEGRRARVMMDLVRDQSRASISHADQAADRAARQVAAHGAMQLARQTTAALGIPVTAPDRTLPTIVEHFVHENAVRIKSLAGRTLDTIESTIARGFVNGDRHEKIGAEIRRQYDISERHARLLARDQIAKLNTQIARSRHLELGVKKFVWLTVGDQKVRPTHASKNGKIWGYLVGGEAPVPPFFPGDEHSCRCSEQPVFSDLLDQLDALLAT